MNLIQRIKKSSTLYISALISVLLLVAIFVIKGDLEIFDLKFFYTKSAIQPILIALGEEGRAKYEIINYLDFVLIGTYSVFFASAYYNCFHEATAKSLLVVPLALAITDVLETGFIFYLLKVFPLNHEGGRELSEYILMFMTPLKWFFVLSSFLVIVNGYVLNYYMKNVK